MTALTMHDRRLDGQGLAFDLIDILRLAEVDVAASTWRCSNVESIGGSSADLHRSARDGTSLTGSKMLSLATALQRVVAGTFTASRPGESQPWLVIRAVDGAFYGVMTDDAALLAAIRSRFRDVRDAPWDAAWVSSAPPVRRRRPRRCFRTTFFLCFLISAPLAGFLGFMLEFGIGMQAFGATPPSRGEVAVVDLFTRFPIPASRSFTLLHPLNTTIWAACFSLALAWILTDRRPPDGVQV